MITALDDLDISSSVSPHSQIKNLYFDDLKPTKHTGSIVLEKLSNEDESRRSTTMENSNSAVYNVLREGHARSIQDGLNVKSDFINDIINKNRGNF